MASISAIRRVERLCAPIAIALVAAFPVQGEEARERFTALAVNMSHPDRAGTGMVEMVVSRWSTDAERDRLLAVLMEKGPEKLLDALQDLPRVGYIRTPNSIGYDLRFARRATAADGGERIVLVTDRYMSFWEVANRPRSIDYPFTVIELRIQPNGKGEGKMSLATRITADKDQKLVVLENYSTQPVLLQSVRRESQKER